VIEMKWMVGEEQEVVWFGRKYEVRCWQLVCIRGCVYRDSQAEVFEDWL